MPDQLTIVGAGLAGLLAAHAWPRAELLEAENGPRAMHKALLRFRSDAVSRLTGIEFEPVLVRKGIWFEHEFRQPDIQLANYYCTKTTGRIIGDRSIWDLAPVKRFVAPETFYDQLVDTIGPRIRWSSSVRKDSCGDAPLISTIPMPSMLELCAMPASQKDFLRAPIAVKRYRLKGVRAYQTIYFPDPVLHVYRASITGSLLIVEYGGGDTGDTRKADEELDEIAHAFGFPSKQPIELIDESIQRYGKIIPLKTVERKRLLHQLTVEHGVYSLGRFATWRNVLLDDCVQDIDVIRRLLKSNSYDAARFALA